MCLQNTLFLLSILIFQSCEFADKESFKPGYSGNFGELVVVSEKWIWDGAVGDEIREALASSIYGLPQKEPHFLLINATRHNFINALHTHRNVVFLEIDEKQTGASFELKKGKWAKGQLLAELSAGSEELLIKKIRSSQEDLRRVFNDVEVNRLIDKNRKFGDEKLSEKIQAEFGVSMNIHKDAELVKLSSDLLLLRIERVQAKSGFEHQISQGILLVKEPYHSLNQFLDDSLLAKKDAFIRKNIQGSSPDIFMTTEYNYIPPKFRELNFRNTFAKESRGLWKMEQGFMGGPFYALSFLDEKNSNIIHCYAYVFSPEFEKREYLREVEAIVKSILF